MKNIYLLILILLSIKCISQEKNTNTYTLPQEKIYLHYNSNFLLSGEKLYYKIYNLTENNQPSKLSKIAYIEVINEKKNSVFKQKIQLEKGTGYGDIFFPSNLKTGTYKLISYTNWMRNNNSFYEDFIYIINPFINKLKAKKASTKNLNLLDNSTRKSYAKREKVTLKYPEQKGNYSISVRKITNDIPSKTSIKTFSQKYDFEKVNDNYNYIPELRGNLISGTIESFKNQNKHGKKIALSTIEEYPFTKITTTNKNGEFYFNLKNNNNSKLLLQILDKDREAYTIKINNNPFIYKDLKFDSKISLTDSLVKTINERTVYMQIENSYSIIKRDSIYFNKKKEFISSLKKKVYVLNDYKRFKTVKETTVEILNDVWLSKEKNNYTFHVRDQNLKTNKELPTLLIVDGYIVFNHNDLIDFNTNKIKQISIAKEKYVYGGKLYQGIIEVKTFDKDYFQKSKNTLTVNILKPESLKKYFFQTYKSNNKRQNKIPDYRTQLFWNPNIKLNNQEISFYTSDVIGNYKIEIQGFDNKGTPVHIESYFSVQ
ncbi:MULTISPECIES: hypothetical protein [unclassified Tenacibaculum]|uniref:hypothetical protein n=1 Tax=unclassified Tenacibaculum TaxID=2635139 RepID=UPI001F207766|nr:MULTISPECIES: hypothetical protein [unclassified Tenacibaculum]MCF2873202.1 hypothetical protein [Tenacibaculum sp. Cn5-1]MCF2933358.1 hypothetical protein [Tenacibaculum sp. Cn5-34]MCG7510061.1 hypothetical protein [Tenacibaculum sp. Cn5-46]